MAAGKGTRMKSDLPKVLFPILDKPMLGYLLKTVLEHGPDGLAVLVGHGGEQVRDYVKNFSPSIEILWQTEQLGTGHAVRVAAPWWRRFDHVLVLNGDLPFLGLDTLRSFAKAHLEEDAACSLLTFVTERPEGYGRVLREPGIAIVEEKDASPRQRLVKEVNGGCYIFRTKPLSEVIGRLGNDNAQKEYYLPDAVTLLSEAGLKIAASAANEAEMLGINTQEELSAVTRRMKDALAMEWMAKGVRIMDPNAVWIGPDVELGRGVSLMPGVQIWGRSVVGEDSTLGAYCVLKDAVLGRRVRLNANVIVEDSELRDDSEAGPFAYIRAASVLDEGAYAGKFVEIKNTAVGKSSKVSHFSYMGDAVLGEDVNIGAGSVTCNFDGKDKFTTKIGDRCFVGSDTMMVAPVTLGNDSITGAGSTITMDVPEGALAIARAPQRNIEGWALRKKCPASIDRR